MRDDLLETNVYEIMFFKMSKSFFRFLKENRRVRRDLDFNDFD